MDSLIILFIILVIVGLFVAGVYFLGTFFDTLPDFLEDLARIRKGNRTHKKKEVKDPATLLKLRYVKGEIKKEEYEEMKKTIEK